MFREKASRPDVIVELQRLAKVIAELKEEHAADMKQLADLKYQLDQADSETDAQETAVKAHYETIRLHEETIKMHQQQGRDDQGKIGRLLTVLQTVVDNWGKPGAYDVAVATLKVER